MDLFSSQKLERFVSICRRSEMCLKLASSTHAVATMQKLFLLQKQGHLCDVVLRTEQTDIFAHRNVLAAASPYFAQVFEMQADTTPEERITLVNIDGVSGPVLSAIVDYCYSGELQVQKSLVEATLMAATILQMAEVEGFCRQYLDVQKPAHLVDEVARSDGDCVPEETVLKKPARLRRKKRIRLAASTASTEKQCIDAPTLKASHVKTFSCKYCPYSCSRGADMDNHIKLHSLNDQEVFVCSLCHYRCTAVARMKVHTKSHQDVKQYQCNLCGLRLSSGYNLNRHLDNAHRREEQSANVSDPSPSNSAATSGGTVAARHVCPHCDFVSIYSGQFERHLESHMAKLHKCQLCSQSFSTETSLMSHLERHADTLPFRCTFCPYQTTTERYLKRHKTRHAKQRLASLNVPVSTSASSRKCPFCQQIFSTTKTLKRHLHSKHNGADPFSCQFCSYKATTASRLRVHMKKAHKIDALKTLPTLASSSSSSSSPSAPALWRPVQLIQLSEESPLTIQSSQ